MSQSISFEVSDSVMAEVSAVAKEMGLDVSEIARSAFESYLDGVRAARSGDLDEGE